MRVEVAYAPRAQGVEVVALELPEGATVADALRASGLVSKHGLDEASLRVGVWCKVRELTAPLREADRVEVYRSLLVDPKEARRLRYKQHLEAVAARAQRKPAA